jgi:hypothetical protein
MINGAHTIIYSTDAVADRNFLRDVLKLNHVDAGEGWLIFGLPPTEIGVHPGEMNSKHEFYLMCEDVEAFVEEMSRHDVACGPVQDQGWGVLTQLTLPGGGAIGVYQPRHARPKPMSSKKAKRKPAKKVVKKPAKRISKVSAKKKRGR